MVPILHDSVHSIIVSFALWMGKKTKDSAHHLRSTSQNPRPASPQKKRATPSAVGPTSSSSSHQNQHHHHPPAPPRSGQPPQSTRSRKYSNRSSLSLSSGQHPHSPPSSRPSTKRHNSKRNIVSSPKLAENIGGRGLDYPLYVTSTSTPTPQGPSTLSNNNASISLRGSSVQYSTTTTTTVNNNNNNNSNSSNNPFYNLDERFFTTPTSSCPSPSSSPAAVATYSTSFPSGISNHLYMKFPDPTEDEAVDIAVIVDPDFLPRGREASCSPTMNLPRTSSLNASGWRYVAPPLNQRTFFFAEDNIEFSSQFDSGNLIQMERLGPFRYNAYNAMDCANTPEQTNNRQWFHFSVRGGTKGAIVSINVIGVMHSKMFTFDWTPVIAVRPSRPQYQRLPGKAVVVSLENMPPTPGYPQMVHKKRDDQDSLELPDADDDLDLMTGANSLCYSLPPLPGGSGGGGGGKGARRRKKKDIAMSLAFEFRIDNDIPLKSPFPLGHPNCPAIYIASNHPYPYETLQRHLATWEIQAQRKPAVSTTAAMPSMPTTTTAPIFFHREVLCKTLDRNNVDLITISDKSGMQAERMPLLCSQMGIPFSSAQGLTERPPKFAGKLYVVLSARVHPGECPSSHMMHGCIEFLLHRTDPRAAALRQKFVFLIIPMINPDGVVRGHSRADSCGVDLNRMYRNPCFFKQPAPYSIRLLLNQLAAEKKLALFIDMHAHANKKGTFFYGNSMSSTQQLQALLYTKLVALNTPFFEFSNCNFTESNMFATGKAGKGKDSSSRVVVYLDTGFPLSFTIEASHVAGKSFTPISSIPGFTEDTQDTQGVNANVRYSPLTFGDTGRGLLLALLDMKGFNPISRIPQTMFHSVRGVTLWLQRQLQIEIAERLFVQAYRSGVKSDLTDPATVVHNVMSTLSEDDVPDKMTLRNARSLPPLTLNGLKDFFSLDTAATILSQTPPAGPPRSLLCGVAQRRAGSSMPAVLSTSAGGVGGQSGKSVSLMQGNQSSPSTYTSESGYVSFPTGSSS